ncbi:hypothetical protein BCR37DRAFT_412121 [Protomyces lactucae-debilis]|uniref:Uncharacterized protein n=1 Tax=Protomyces lactucae-debilis TaxID=2754530 RepID=A0A1Y2FUJ6_PROLT|nr:uncharacterized protein BCR37DRAFT_412121 [Protomyces lactucae-debilis]ORY86365.1 hypothetical protein BCR37DRAFT_412121 [Protomyces lactucae-debilis]
MSPSKDSSLQHKRHAGFLSLILVFISAPSMSHMAAGTGVRPCWLELKAGASYKSTPGLCNLNRVCGTRFPDNCMPVDMNGTNCPDQKWFAIRSYQRGVDDDGDCFENEIVNRAGPQKLESLVAGYCHPPVSAKQKFGPDGPPYAKLFWDDGRQQPLIYNIEVDDTTGKHKLVLGGCE